ncbi:MAG TPA: methyltransferase domain-containing protein [Holophagaceae bacterium]|jgi:SAM-dependent methyltransferase|nr:methyltransferase domain-containing protein [Holophagaceae bacterium]
MFRTSDDWNRIYAEEPKPGWDMDGPTPLLDELLAEAPLAPGARIAVPGCGFGHDAAELARRGFAMTAFDIAPLAIEGARARHGEAVAWRLEDWFNTGEGAFEAVFDHTCFVAMEPTRREEYAAATFARLAPGGLWLGAAFHDTGDRTGPPFAIPPDAMGELIRAAGFELLMLKETTASHPRRAGREFLWIARRM